MVNSLLMIKDIYCLFGDGILKPFKTIGTGPFLITFSVIWLRKSDWEELAPDVELHGKGFLQRSRLSPTKDKWRTIVSHERMLKKIPDLVRNHLGCNRAVSE